MIDALFAVLEIVAMWRFWAPTVAFAVLAYFVLGGSYVWLGIAIGVPLGVASALAEGEAR